MDKLPVFKSQTDFYFILFFFIQRKSHRKIRSICFGNARRLENGPRRVRVTVDGRRCFFLSPPYTCPITISSCFIISSFFSCYLKKRFIKIFYTIREGGMTRLYLVTIGRSFFIFCSSVPLWLVPQVFHIYGYFFFFPFLSSVCSDLIHFHSEFSKFHPSPRNGLSRKVSAGGGIGPTYFLQLFEYNRKNLFCCLFVFFLFLHLSKQEEKTQQIYAYTRIYMYASSSWSREKMMELKKWLFKKKRVSTTTVGPPLFQLLLLCDKLLTGYVFGTSLSTPELRRYPLASSLFNYLWFFSFQYLEKEKYADGVAGESHQKIGFPEIEPETSGSSYLFLLPSLTFG